MFNEDNIIKQLFKLNYDKQKEIEKLNRKIATIKYQSKYLRIDVKTQNSELRIKDNQINHLNQVLDKFKTELGDDMFNSIIAM